MANPIDRALIRRLFLQDIPLLDVRAPLEFAQGSFPMAENQPLMTDQERHEVGLCYKNQGQEAAINLGHKLVSGETRQQRLQQWKQFAQQHPEAYLYCFRGGLRSRTVQQWLKQNGVDLPLVNGGYKAMRRVLIDELEESVENSELVILGGKTGTGKTWLLKELSPAIDLESLANHRGSSFGRFPDGQPSQIDFENKLSIQWMKLRERNIQQFWLEDESRLIGSLSIPQTLRQRMMQSPLVMLEEPLEFRISVILKDYVIDLLEFYNTYYSKLDDADDHVAFHYFSTYLLASLERVKKRLGGVRYEQIRKQMEAALRVQQQAGAVEEHRQWIESLLTGYYDPMYDYQLEKKQHRVIFRGNSHQIMANQKKILQQGKGLLFSQEM
jgi:tRNA 2-selenouridine synthase